MAITTVKIYPAIGIARLGNSPDFFIGPELPGDHSVPPGGYKDARCLLRKQAARFRLFGFDGGGNLVGEITAANATITWTAHLVNGKGVADLFHPSGSAAGGPRNPSVANRASLVIDPGPRTIVGPNQAAGFNTGKFLGQVVPLGEMRTDADGRLIILGGDGAAGSPTNAPLDANPFYFYANNDGWYDDVSDGPITATVKLNGSVTTIQAADAWVICTPPRYAPSIEHIVTLYDVLYQVAVDKGWLTPPAKPSFNQDIFPILDRAEKIKYVFDYTSHGDAVAHGSLTAAFPPAGDSTRQIVTGMHRDPATPPHTATIATDMPRIWSDVFDTATGANQPLTKTQFAAMQKWAQAGGAGFTNDWTGTPPPPATQITPDGLTEAALQNCVGAGLVPGIETSYQTPGYAFVEPFRLDVTQVKPGDLTQHMAVPWQSDFFDCTVDMGGPPGYYHLWWPVHRPLQVIPQGGGAMVAWDRGIATTKPDLIANFHRLGFVVVQGNQFVETERRVVCQDCFMVVDRSTFSDDEVNGQLSGGSPAVFDLAFYVIVEGFRPSELGVNTPTPTPMQLQAIAPSVAIQRPDSSTTSGMTAVPIKLLCEDPSLPDQPQRFTFQFAIQFADISPFNGIESETETLTATIKGKSCTGAIELTHQPNPYMLDGPVSWLSVDVQVFKANQDDSPLGVPVNNDPVGFIQTLLGNFDSAKFQTFLPGADSRQLELSRSVNNKRVYNFAIAQLRYIAKTLPANDVRVFFRMFTTAATGLDYQPSSTYARYDDGTKVVPLLGVQGEEVVSIPCFAGARVDPSVQKLTDQPADTDNVQNIAPGGAVEQLAYFGCWLDFNQTEPRIPLPPVVGVGPFSAANLVSVQDAIRGLHQCLVAEVYFGNDPTPVGATPGSSDNLSQRNLNIVESDNPGGRDSHTVCHTFELKPSVVAAYRGTQFAGAVAHADERLLFHTEESIEKAPAPDELMLRWIGIPHDTEVTLYLPQVDAKALLAAAGKMYDTPRIQLVDAHTIGCLVGDVTYVPIPPSDGKHLAGLMTLVLPDTVRDRQVFRVIAHQFRGYRGGARRILGSFQLTIPVSMGDRLLEAEIRRLSVLRSINERIPVHNRWHPVFARYLDQIAGRVRGFGGDPSTVKPSPDGDGGRHHIEEKCPHCLLAIPWDDCAVEGEIDIRIRFRKKPE